MITFIESGNRIATENFEIGEIYTITFTNGNYKTMCCAGIGVDFIMFQDKLPTALFCLTLGTAETVLTIELGGGGSGTMNYNELENKPQINGIVLIGNKTASDLNLVSQSELADYATNASVVSALASKQDQLTTAQLTAVNSGITSDDVTQITENKNNISAVCDYGGKNIFEPTITSGVYYGLTITVNADNSISISNTTPLSESKYITLGTATPKKAATYTFDGTPSGVTTNTGGYMRIEQGSSGVSQVLSPVDIDLNNTQAYTVYLRVLVGKTYDITLKPMLCFKTLYQASSTYEPYAPSNRELYEMIKALQ